MGFHYVDRVLKYVEDTTATEQHVLTVLAQLADDKTGQCYPSAATIARYSHLGRSTIMRSLDSLKDKGLIQWKSGGRKKSGHALSNLYSLNVPCSQPRKKTETSVPERDGDLSQSGTMQCPTAGLCSVPERDTIINNISSIYHPDSHNPAAEAAGDTTPGRFELGVARREGTIDDVLSKMASAELCTKRSEQIGVVDMAMEATSTDKPEDKRTYSLVILRKNPADCIEAIHQFVSERAAGEMKKIKNLPALLTKRLVKLKDRTDIGPLPPMAI